MQINYRLDSGAYAPLHAHKADAGFDLRAPYPFIVPGFGCVVIDTGVHVEIPNNYVGFLKSKSGLNVKHSIVSEGVIDAGYTGSIVVKLYNHSPDGYIVGQGDKITQLVFLPIATDVIMNKVETFAETERGDNGFGSTGK